MKKISFVILISAIAILVGTSFKKNTITKYHTKPLRTSGAASVFDFGYTGAPFDGSCSNCHGGGSYAPTINVQLLNTANAPVTEYIPGANYTLRISLTAASGTPQWGFQTTSVNAGTNTNLNSWGATLPPNTNNTAISSGRNYIEQITRLNSGIINIPWQAPLASFGTVRFYSIGNAVNSNGNSGGDNATTTNTLTISEGVVPVKLTAFNAKKINNEATLFWQTAQEVNNHYFNIERSSTGNNFTAIGKVQGNGTTNILSNYTFADKAAIQGINFYRLAQTDLDGRINYSPIITYKNTKANATFTVLPNPVANFIMLQNTELIGSTFCIFNSAGTILSTSVVQSQKIALAELPKGNYFIKIISKNNENVVGSFVK